MVAVAGEDDRHPGEDVDAVEREEPGRVAPPVLREEPAGVVVAAEPDPVHPRLQRLLQLQHARLVGGGVGLSLVELGEEIGDDGPVGILREVAHRVPGGAEHLAIEDDVFLLPLHGGIHRSVERQRARRLPRPPRTGRIPVGRLEAVGVDPVAVDVVGPQVVQDQFLHELHILRIARVGVEAAPVEVCLDEPLLVACKKLRMLAGHRAAGGEPVDHHVEEHPHAKRMGPLDERLEVVGRAKRRIDLPRIGVAVAAHPVGHQVERVEADLVVERQLVGEAAKPAVKLRHHLQDHHLANPVGRGGAQGERASELGAVLGLRRAEVGGEHDPLSV